MMDFKNMSKEQLISLNQQLTRLAVPKQVRISLKLYNTMMSQGLISQGKGMPPFNGIKVQIDNSIDAYEFDY